jgi:hypothetical protein
MAKTIYLKESETLKDLIGRFVYLSYTPARCGVIKNVYESNESDKKDVSLGPVCGSKPHLICLVEWLKITKTYPDKLTTHRLNSLNDFEELVKDHKNKYLKHEKTLGKLQNLKYNNGYGIWVLKKGKSKSLDLIHVEKFLEEPSQKDYDKLKKQYPNDIVEVCPKNLVETVSKNSSERKITADSIKDLEELKDIASKETYFEL